ncbi:acyltransferase [Bacillus sp. RO3]|nr:acyltransferase [Bacillus sp. RO3]
MAGKVRLSNFESLRVLSMVMIVLLHFGTYGLPKVVSISELSQMNQFLFTFIKVLCIVGVNVYVLISGYFLCTSQFKMSKAFRVVRETFIFSVLIFAGMALLQRTDGSTAVLFKSVFPVYLSTYWFITVYMLLFLLSPYLNILINQLSKKEYGKLLVLLFMVNCVWQFFHPLGSFGVNGGYSIVHFIFMYFVAGYLRHHGQRLASLNKLYYLSVYILVGAGTALVVQQAWDLPFKLLTYNSPVIVIMSAALFLFFSKLSFVSGPINAVSGYVLGVYLIHEHPLIRQRLWSNVAKWMDAGNPVLLFGQFLLYGMVVFGICLGISYVIYSMINYKTFFKRKTPVKKVKMAG